MDFIIVIVETYNLNKKPMFIGFDIIKKEIEKTISIITRKIKINVIDEIFFCLENLKLEDNMENLENIKVNKIYH